MRIGFVPKRKAKKEPTHISICRLSTSNISTFHELKTHKKKISANHPIFPIKNDSQGWDGTQKVFIL